MELAVATRTHPDQWWDTDPAIVATVMDVLEQQNKRRR